MTDNNFEKTAFLKRLKTMLKVDFRRTFSTSLYYLMVGISFIMPILILVMTTAFSEPTVDKITGTPTVTESFTNVWQTIGSVSGSSSMSMGLTTTCNINLIFFIASVLVCLFIGDDFKSGFVKNLFTVRAKKSDYVISKTIVGFIGGFSMLAAYFIGAMLGGAIANLSFDVEGTTVSGIIACLISKSFLMLIFVSIFTLASVIGKQQLWLSILVSLFASMLLFMMIDMIAPLNSNLLNVILSLAGGLCFAVGLGAISNAVLKKTSAI